MPDTRIKNNIIRNLKNTYCRLKLSSIDGIGVFAIRDIPKDQNPFSGIKKQNWYKLKTSDFKNFGPEIIKMINDFFVIEKNGETWVPEFGLNGMDISFFLNNSPNPNVKRIERSGDFLTLRKIRKGEELMVSYGTFDWKY